MLSPNTCPVYQPLAPPAEPHRPPRPLSPWQWLWTAHDNLIATWSTGAFLAGVKEYRLPGRHMFLANSAEAVRHVLVSNATNYRKSRDTRRMLRPLIGEGLFISEGELWTHQRRVILPALHRRLLPDYLGTMAMTIQEMLNRWQSAGDGIELDLSREMTWVTADVVSRTLLSTPLDSDRALTVYKAFTDYQDSLGRFDVLGFVGLPDWFPRPSIGKGRAAVKKLDTIVDTIIAEHERSHPRRFPDLLDRLKSATPMAGMAPSLKDEVKVMFLAGHETTASSLCWAFHLLSLYPEIEDKVYREAQRVLPSQGLPDFEHVSAMHYTRAVMEESLRLYPPLHVLGREAIDTDRLGGKTVLPGSLVVIAPWVLHRHRRYWPHPDSFIPERFLPPWRDGQRPRHCYIPFGAGRRICPGAAFGMTEAILILAMVSRHFHLQPLPERPVYPVGRLTLRPQKGLWMRLQRRVDSF